MERQDTLTNRSQEIFIIDNSSGISYYLRGVQSLDPKIENSLTEYPTVEGTPINDHAFRLPNEFNLTFIESEINSGSNFYYFNSSNQRISFNIQEVKALFQSWLDNFTRLTIQTRNYRFKNMVVYKLSWSENDKNKGIYNPTLSLKELRVANLNTLQLGPFSSPERRNTYTGSSDNGNNGGVEWQDTLSSVTGGAAAGALIGSFIPGIGTGVGALIGGAWGFFKSLSKK